MERDLSHMTKEQYHEYYIAVIRMNRIVHGIDPETAKRRDDWNEPKDDPKLECRGNK